MRASLVLTVIAADRPGIVRTLAKVASEHGANWVESHMARLGGRFAGILRLDVDTDRAQALTNALRALSASGMTVVVEPAEAEAQAERHRPGLVLEVLGHDRPGIVRELSEALAKRNVNVTSLETGLEMAPMSGHPLFRAHAVLAVDADTDLDDLHDEIAFIAQELHVDFSLDDETDED
jgi:glycine cleavage system regulatory protein